MSSSAEARPPRASATVMLLREAAEGLEVLMTRRHENLAFMGGVWVFPGGTLHPSDTAPRTLARILDPAKAQRQNFSTLSGTSLLAQESLGLAVAACRETFEETGVLLAVDANGRPCPNDLCERLQAERKSIAARPELFASLLEQEQLLLDVERLVYWSHWITPSSAPRRFDTRFFAIAVEADRSVTADSTETTECRWIDPAIVVALAERGEMPVSPPTLCNLVDLRESHARHGSLQALLAAESLRSVPPILPKMIDASTQTTVVLPWDSGYAALAGDSAPADIEYSGLLWTRLSRLTLRGR